MVKSEIIILSSDQESAPFLKGEELVNAVFFSQKPTNSFLERKILNAFLKIGLESGMKSERSLFVYFSTLKKIIKLKSNNTSSFYSAIRSINEIRLKTNDVESTDFIKPVRVNLMDEGVEFEIHKIVFDMQARSKNFIQLDMSFVVKLKSFYASGLYEVILLGVNTGVTSIISIDNLVELLQLNKQSDIYMEFRELNNHVIKPALKKINQLAGIDAVLQKHNGGRKVIGISFRITPKPLSERFKNADLSSARSWMLELGISKDVIDSLFQQYDLTRILGNINHIVELSKRREIKDIPAYVIVAIKKNYAQVVKPVSTILADVEPTEFLNNASLIDMPNLDFEKISEIMENQSQTERQGLISDFERFLDEFLPFLKQNYLKYKFKSHAICVAFSLFQKHNLATC